MSGAGLRSMHDPWPRQRQAAPPPWEGQRRFGVQQPRQRQHQAAPPQRHRGRQEWPEDVAAARHAPKQQPTTATDPRLDRRALGARSARSPLSPPTNDFPFLVVVEGLNDMHAVRRAVPAADVYVLGTSSAAGSAAVLQDLQSASRRYPSGLLLLLDPDVAGRQARRLLDERLPGCLHAFVPSVAAVSRAATRYHEAGNVGVEHAQPAAIRAALSKPRASDPQRREFDREHLLHWGLANKLHARGGNVTQRRSHVCAYLGLGECDGKQLLRQLNLYGFTRDDVERALAWAANSAAAQL